MYKIDRAHATTSHTKTPSAQKRRKRAAIIHESTTVISPSAPSSSMDSDALSIDSAAIEVPIDETNTYQLYFHLAAGEYIVPQNLDIRVHITLHSVKAPIDKDCYTLLVNNITEPQLFVPLFFEQLLTKILLQYQDHDNILDLFVTIVYNIDSQGNTELIWKSPYEDVVKATTIKYVKKSDAIYSLQNRLLNDMLYHLNKIKKPFLLSLLKNNYVAMMLQIICDYLQQYTLISIPCDLHIVINSIMTNDFCRLMRHLTEKKVNETLKNDMINKNADASIWHLTTIVCQEDLGKIKIVGIYGDTEVLTPSIRLESSGKSAITLTSLSDHLIYPLLMTLAKVLLTTKLTQLAQARIMLDLLHKESSFDLSLPIRNAEHIEKVYRDTLLMQLNRLITKLMTLQKDLKQHIDYCARSLDAIDSKQAIEPFILRLDLLLDERQQRQTDIVTLKNLDKDVTVFINTMAMFYTLLQTIPDLLTQACQAASLSSEQKHILDLFFPHNVSIDISHEKWTDNILVIPKRTFNIQDSVSDTLAIIRNRTKIYHRENLDVYKFFSTSIVFYVQSLDYLWLQTGFLLQQSIDLEHQHHLLKPNRHIQKMLKLINSWLDDIKDIMLKLNITYEVAIHLICDEAYYQAMQVITDTTHKIQQVIQMPSSTSYEHTKTVKLILSIDTIVAHQALTAITQILQQYQTLLLEIQNLNRCFETYKQLRDEQQKSLPVCPLQKSIHVMLNTLLQRHLFELYPYFSFQEIKDDTASLTLPMLIPTLETLLHQHYALELYPQRTYIHVQPKTLTLSQSFLGLVSTLSSSENLSPLSVYSSKTVTFALLDGVIKWFSQLKWSMINIIHSYTTIQTMLVNKALHMLSEQLVSYLPSELRQLIQDIGTFTTIRSGSASSSTQQLGTSLLNHLADIELDVVTECVNKVKQTLQTIRYHANETQQVDLFGLIEHYRQCDWIISPLLEQWDDMMTLSCYQTYAAAIAEREYHAPFPEIQSLGYQSPTKIHIVFLSVLVALISAFTAAHSQTVAELTTPFEQSIYRLLKSKDTLTWRLISEWLLTPSPPPIALIASLQQITVVFKYLETCEQADPVYRGTRFFSHYIRLKLFELSARQILEYGYMQASLATFALAIGYLTSLAEYLHPLKTSTHPTILMAEDTEPLTREEEVLTVFTRTGVNNHDDSLSMRLCCGFFSASPRPAPPIEVLSPSNYQALRANM